MLVDGVVTHAVRKRPTAGDFRIHEHYGGAFEPMTSTAALVELAERVVAALPAPTLYARVDVVRSAGQLHVIEVEVTEPRASPRTRAGAARTGDSSPRSGGPRASPARLNRPVRCAPPDRPGPTRPKESACRSAYIRVDPADFPESRDGVPALRADRPGCGSRARARRAPTSSGRRCTATRRPSTPSTSRR